MGYFFGVCINSDRESDDIFNFGRLFWKYSSFTERSTFSPILFKLFFFLISQLTLVFLWIIFWRKNHRNFPKNFCRFLSVLSTSSNIMIRVGYERQTDHQMIQICWEMEVIYQVRESNSDSPLLNSTFWTWTAEGLKDCYFLPILKYLHCQGWTISPLKYLLFLFMCQILNNHSLGL